MISRKSLADRIRDGDPLSAPLAVALSALTPVQRVGMALRRMQKVHRVNARVISFGNITAGGTGKTPAVIERALQELDAGHRVAVLTRGYAAPSGSQPADSADLGGATPYHALGDEAALILQNVPGVIVIKNPDRVAGAQRAIDRHDCDTLILDDGFQYLRLARDEDIVLINAANPFGNRELLPRGLLREPITALARATGIIVTHADTKPADQLFSLYAEVAVAAPGVPIRATCHGPTGLRNVATGERLPLESLEGQKITAVCGIANPQRFVSTLADLGAVVDQLIATSDHRSVDARELPRDRTIVTTEKDAVRGTFTGYENVLALEVELQDI